MKAIRDKQYEELRNKLIPQAEREADAHVFLLPPGYFTDLEHAKYFGMRMQELAEAHGLTDGMPK